DKRQMVRIAKMYYFQGLTQSEIANKVGISRPIISKLLQKARECGIVEIVIKDDTLRTVDLEQKLESEFPMKEVLVVPVDDPDNEEINKRNVGKRSEEHTSELQSRENLVCRLLLEKKNTRESGDQHSGDEHAYV